MALDMFDSVETMEKDTEEGEDAQEDTTAAVRFGGFGLIILGSNTFGPKTSVQQMKLIYI